MCIKVIHDESEQKKNTNEEWIEKMPETIELVSTLGSADSDSDIWYRNEQRIYWPCRRATNVQNRFRLSFSLYLLWKWQAAHSLLRMHNVFRIEREYVRNGNVFSFHIKHWTCARERRVLRRRRVQQRALWFQCCGTPRPIYFMCECTVCSASALPTRGEIVE